MSEQTHIILMAKQPKRGKVKTRLAKGVGKTEALRFFKYCFGKMLQLVINVPNTLSYVSISPESAITNKAWRQNQRHANLTKLNWLKQGSGDLGDRLVTAMQSVPPGAVIIIGSDCPDIAIHDLSTAAKMLRHNDFVIGPAEDGGYWLIGMAARSRQSSIFKDIRWSTEFTLEDTLLKMQGYRVGFLDIKTDVDTIDEYKAFLARN